MTAPSVFTVDGVVLSATITPDWTLTQSADKGTAATSGFNLDDGAAAIAVPALKDTKVEFGAATPARAFTGYTIGRGEARNDEAIMGPAATDRRYQVNVTDLNSLLVDRILHGSGGKRPVETDIARINWLLGSPYLAGLVFDNGQVDTANPVSQEEQDFGGQFALDILVKCSESSGKNFFVDWDPGAGQPTLNYRIDGTSASRESDVLISNDPADIDLVNVFPPNEAASLDRDPATVYSGIYYQGANGINAYVRSAANERNFRQREISISDSQVKTVAKAISLSRAYLTRIGIEQATVTVTIKLAIADANRVAAGMRMQVKFTELTGFGTYQWINVNKCTKRPVDGTQEFMYLDLTLLNLINTGFHGSTTPPGTTNPAPGPPIPPTPPYPIPPCGITDSFNRPDDGASMNTSDSGRVWETLTGVAVIASNEGEFPSPGGGSAQLPGPWPVPFHGTMDVTGAVIPLLPAYLEASDWGPSWQGISSLGGRSVDGSVAFLDSDDASVATNVPIVDAFNGGFDVFLSLVPGASLVGSPDLEWHFAAAGFTFVIRASSGGFDLVASPGGPSDPGGPTFTHYGPGAWFYVFYQYTLAGAVSPVECSTAISFDSYAGFIAGGITDIAQCLINAIDSAEMDFDSLSTTVGPSIWGPPVTPSTVDAVSLSGAIMSPPTAGFFDTNVTEFIPQISDFGWFWTTTGLAADGTTTLEYTAAYLSTGHAPPGGADMWDPGTDPPAFDVPTPLIYVDVTDGVTHARGWARLGGDLSFPFSPVVDIDDLGITITVGTLSARANNADASLPANGILNAPLVLTETSGLGAAMTFDQLNITGVNRCGTTSIPTGPIIASTIPLSVDATGSTDVSGPLSDFINGLPAGTVAIFPAGATYQCALKLHGLLNVELNGQGCTLQAPAGGFTENFSTLYFQSFGGSNVNVQVHDFHLIGTSPTPGVFISGHEGQHGILVDGSSNVEIWNIVCEAMFGDFLEVNSGATLIHAHDCTVPNTGRNGLSVIFGNNVTFGPNITLVTMGYMPYDVEPNDASESCFDIFITGDHSASWTNAFFAVDGSATGAAIHDIEVANCDSTGFSLLTLVNPSAAGPEQNVSFNDNSSDVPDSGPVLTFKNVDGLVVQHNTQALSSGVLVSDPGCTNTTIGPNP